MSAERTRPAAKPTTKSAARKKRSSSKKRANEPSLFGEEPHRSPVDSTHAQANVVYTIGHSTLPIEDFLARLKAHDVTLLVDVRKMPGSRRHPQFGRDALAAALAREGIRYVHAPELGGFRKARPDSPNTAWRNASFRGYADYMQTPEFEAAIEPIVARAAEEKQALMCAEAVPWRCHRSLLADALTVRGLHVADIQSPTRTSPHELPEHARVKGTQVLYPAPE